MAEGMVNLGLHFRLGAFLELGCQAINGRLVRENAITLWDVLNAIHGEILGLANLPAEPTNRVSKLWVEVQARQEE